MDIIIEGKMPAIIDKDTFTNAQAKAISNQKRRQPNRAKEKFIPFGVIFELNVAVK